MSHFYDRKSYTFGETDEMITEIKKEMSNFLTKEEAELILQRKYAMIDPPPYFVNYSELQNQIQELRQEIYFLRTLVHKLSSKIDIDEPTL